MITRGVKIHSIHDTGLTIHGSIRFLEYYGKKCELIKILIENTAVLFLNHKHCKTFCN